ncbi:sugar porter family MFS transporter [Mycobacterium sp. M1]|uniref:Sugar porter family MFS transporter n=1 Tax=Mycolicibacter acidiphilus TaxID=2835306 RepID=A0ABS5RGA0_9MYCO|nr:sugar porter family MFS transporter [Mycolicibacter acidiphilus]MBS9533022.1 sugar porter family MFS transporter [Mycolicibacter acidiphilus]
MHARVAVRAASAAAIGGLVFGYDVSLINSTIGAIRDEFVIGPVVLGMVAGVSLLGAAVGAILTGRIADRLGRLAVMRLAAALYVIGAVGAGLAIDIEVLVVFRVISGLGIGVTSAVIPAYIAEVSPPQLRGRLGSLKQLAIVCGIFVAPLVGWALMALAGGADADLWLGLPAWRWMFFAEAIPALAYGAMTITLPESPRHLVAVQRLPQARRVIALLYGERDADATVDAIRETLGHEVPPSWRVLHRPGGGLYPIVWVGLGLAVFQQIVGINVIFFYSTVLWQAVGFGVSSSFAITVATNAVNVAVTVVAIGLIDRVGRRRLLLAGSAGMTVTLATMTVLFARAPIVDGAPHLAPVPGAVALVAANLFVIAFGVSWGPVVWVLLGEMFPNRIRAAALGLGAAAQWLANWVIAATFPVLSGALGLAFAAYTLNALLSGLFVWRWVRETRGVSLEDMPDHA